MMWSCEVCMNFSEIKRPASSVTGETYHINNKVNCDENCSICLLSCVTVNEMLKKYRWNNYRHNDTKFVRKERYIQDNLLKCYNRMGHNGFLKNMSVRLIYKADGNEPKKREGYSNRTIIT